MEYNHSLTSPLIAITSALAAVSLIPHMFVCLFVWSDIRIVLGCLAYPLYWCLCSRLPWCCLVHHHLRARLCGWSHHSARRWLVQPLQRDGKRRIACKWARVSVEAKHVCVGLSLHGCQSRLLDLALSMDSGQQLDRWRQSRNCRRCHSDHCWGKTTDPTKKCLGY